MRLDKWLWTMRFYKTRESANDACKTARVLINNQNAKASRDVFMGDEIAISRGSVKFTYKIIDLPKGRVGAKLLPLYIVNTTPIKELERYRLLEENEILSRDRGAGRPTKKEARDIGDMFISLEEQDE